MTAVTAAVRVSNTPGGPHEDRALRLSRYALLGVGILFLVLQLLALGARVGLGADEADYLAKVDPHVPELYWSPVRAWGMPVLAFPVTIFSAPIAVVRVWFIVLSSAGVVGAFWPWLRAGRRALAPAAPLAALLLCTTWFSLFYGGQVMPNLWVALSAVALAGLVSGAAQDEGGRRILCVGAVAAGLALIRPTDSLLVLAGLLLAMVVVRDLRRPRLALALVVGIACGWIPWLVEAYARFGDPVARLRNANDNGLHGLHVTFQTLLMYPRLLDGTPGYCCYDRPPEAAGTLPKALTTWLLAFVALSLLGLVASARRQSLGSRLPVVTVFGALAGFYLLLLNYGAVRFLLPLLALASVLVATAIVVLVDRSSPRSASAGFAGLVVGLGLLVGHLSVQAAAATSTLPMWKDSANGYLDQRPHLQRLLASGPCVFGALNPTVRSYYLGCAPLVVDPGRQVEPAGLSRARREGRAVLLVFGGPLPAGSFLQTWQATALSGPGGDVAYRPQP